MNNCSEQNKKAWEYNAYDFWVKTAGTPKERANICGSCGKKAIPLAMLGAEVTVFDISEHNKKYAMEFANEAKVDIDFIVGGCTGN